MCSPVRGRSDGQIPSGAAFSIAKVFLAQTPPCGITWNSWLDRPGPVRHASRCTTLPAENTACLQMTEQQAGACINAWNVFTSVTAEYILSNVISRFMISDYDQMLTCKLNYSTLIKWILLFLTFWFERRLNFRYKGGNNLLKWTW